MPDRQKSLDDILATGEIQAIGVPWYEREDYPEILAIMSDRNLLPKTFDQWLEHAERLEREIAQKGATVARATLKPKAFAAWCAIRGHNIDALARSLFASEQAAKKMGFI